MHDFTAIIEIFDNCLGLKKFLILNLNAVKISVNDPKCLF